MYAGKMNQRIELKKLFGLEGAEQDSIGAMVDKLDMGPNDMARLKETLGAMLSPQGQENWALNKIRKTATLTLLSHFSSTIFQIADAGKNVYSHGPFRTLASFFRAKPIKRDEMFTEIAHEFSDSKFLKNSLKVVGFDRLDRLNNEAYMANAFREATKFARKGKGSGFKALNEYVDVVFRGDELRKAKFLDDIKAKKVTEDTRLYIFNKVLDVDPRALSEMPEAYAKHPNARIFYSMKSYGIKVLDMYRTEASSKKPTWKKAKNMVVLTSVLTAAGATGAQARDWWNGKDTNFSDNVLNNALQLMMLSTYDVSSVQQDGLGRTILGKALPPSRLIDDISKDILSAGDGKGLYSVRNIPVIGAELYNKAGRGAESITKSNTKISGGEYSGTLTADQKRSLMKLKKESPYKYSKAMKEIKWQRMGITDKEKKFVSLGVEDGERAETIYKYLKGDPNWKVRYAKLKKAGIITDDVAKQIRLLMQ
jgi:hypothetical protein